MNNVEIIRQELLALQDIKARDFGAKLIPSVNKDNIIGIKSPPLKEYAKQLYKNNSKAVEEFLKALPHRYMEEYFLHNILLGYEKDVNKLFKELEILLPYVDNWASCDGLCSNLGLLKKYPKENLAFIYRCMNSQYSYTIRYGIIMLMGNFLGEHFEEEQMDKVAGFVSDEYYVNMAKAWYMATALAKQYEAAISRIEGKHMDVFSHNKSIQKAIESYRVSDDRKAYLKSLKIK